MLTAKGALLEPWRGKWVGTLPRAGPCISIEQMDLRSAYRFAVFLCGSAKEAFSCGYRRKRAIPGRRRTGCRLGGCISLPETGAAATLYLLPSANFRSLGGAAEAKQALPVPIICPGRGNGNKKTRLPPCALRKYQV